MSAANPKGEDQDGPSNAASEPHSVARISGTV